MTKAQIDKLLSEGKFPDITKKRKLIETHISWVILGAKFVYKIKKPIKYSFLDFSTLNLRKHYCEREINLNQRFSKNIYLEVSPIYELQDRYYMGGNKGTIIDYAVKMRKLDPKKRMDILLSQHKVSESDIKNLAERITHFHKNAKTIYIKNVLDVQEKFNDLGAEIEFLAKKLGLEYSDLIDRAIKASDAFLSENEKLLKNRLKSGFFKDCHGDLHTRNIFLLPNPQPFDCIEFNDEYRQIDVLNEVAFLCMDLDALGKYALSDLFMEHYNCHFPTIRAMAERKLFVYYK
ncbi:MAG: hypothetical protein ACR2MT_03445, partial [Aurantibacter sp.]